MEKVLIWGTGEYCQDKLRWGDVIHKYEIVGFVDRERKEYQGRVTFLPCEIQNICYDKLIVMSSHYFEIINDAISLGVSIERIIPGIIYRPFKFDEISLMSKAVSVDVTINGSIGIRYNNGSYEEIRNYKEKEELIEKLKGIANVEKIKELHTNPVGKQFGHDRGQSICRYYIEDFLEENKGKIKGKVLEVGDDYYTTKYGGENSNSFVLYYEDGINENNTIYGDFETGVNIPREEFDCIILTQVLDFIYDLDSAINNIKFALKNGGTALITVSGITPISRSDMDRYGHFWNFTDKSLGRLFEEKGCRVVIKTYGNCKSACAFLQGMAVEDFSEYAELDLVDEDFQVLIAAMVEKG